MSRETFDIDITRVNGDRVVRLRGEFDLAGVEAFERRLGADRDAAARRTTFDLAELRFLDSSGLRALIKAEADLRAGGERVVVVVRRTGQVADLLKLTGVADRLELADEVPADLQTPDGG